MKKPRMKARSTIEKELRKCQRAMGEAPTAAIRDELYGCKKRLVGCFARMPWPQ